MTGGSSLTLLTSVRRWTHLARLLKTAKKLPSGNLLQQFLPVLDCCPHFNIRRNTKSSFQIIISLITENLFAPGCEGNYPAKLITDDNNQQPASVSHGCQSLGRRTGFKFHFCCLIPKVGKLRSGGHMWPKELFPRTHRAFTLISLQAKLKGVSFIS